MKGKLILLFSLFLSGVISSCSGVEQPEKLLIGTWLCIESPTSYQNCYYTFQEDGKMVRDYSPTLSASAFYVYNADANTITATLDNRQETFQIVSLASSFMELKGGEFYAGSWKFQKANSVSFPQLKIEEGEEIIIKVGETKKLNLSGMGISCDSFGYKASDGFLSDTKSDYVLMIDNESLSITGQYVGKCRLAIRSKNGEAEIPVVVEPNYPLWEHRYIIDKVKERGVDNLVQELGEPTFIYNEGDRGGHYVYDNISDKIISLSCTIVDKNIRNIIFAIPLNQKDYLEKSLQEYGTGSEHIYVSSSNYYWHNNARIKLNSANHYYSLYFETFLDRKDICVDYWDEVILLVIFL